MKTAFFGVIAPRRTFVAGLGRWFILTCAGQSLRASVGDSQRVIQSLDVDWRFHLSAADHSAPIAVNADLGVITVEVVDAQGRAVPVADNKVTFTLAGPAKLIGVGNGDPSSHEADKANSRSAFNGLAQALVQTTPSSGEITLTAEAPNLKSTRVTLRSR